MESSRERDLFERISLFQEIEKARQMLAKYAEGIAFYHDRIEQHMRQIGRLDERLGDEDG